MADSLDDFFAKKDKSKKKNKKFATSDQQMSRPKTEDGRSPQEKSTGTKKDKEKTNSTTSGNSTSLQYQEQAEEEWGEVEEKEIDYSGLKIQNLQISELRDEEYEREKNEEYSEDDDQYGQRDGSGPWNKNSSSAAPPSQDSQPVSERQSQQPQSQDDAKPSTYCPPQFRNAKPGSGGGGGGGGGGRSGRNKTAPEIDSELHFPSLSAGAEGGAAAKKKSERLADFERGFESVKRGSRNNEDTVNHGPQLDLGNKYDALSHSEAS